MLGGEQVFAGIYLLNYFPFLESYLSILSFLAPIIGGGETGLFAVALFFADKPINFLRIFFFGFLGMYFIDGVWFKLAKITLKKQIDKLRDKSDKYKRIEKSLEKLVNKKDILLLFLAKVMIGTRILMIFYMSSRKNMDFKKYMAYNILPNLGWAFCLVTLGYLTSYGFTQILRIFESVSMAITFLILVLVLIYLIKEWLNKKLIN